MNREQMTSTIWDALERGGVEAHHADWLAPDVLDVILPQVSTVEELEALPVGSVLVTQTGETYARAPGIYFGCDDGGHVSWDAAQTLYERVLGDENGPLTVVWRAES